MSPTTRFILDLVCWFGTAGVLAYWGYAGWAMAVGIVGAVYLAFCWTILQRWLKGEYNDTESEM